VPIDFGTAGNEADKDGEGQFDLVKAARGRLSGAALTIFGWPEIWNGPNAPHKPTEGFIEAARHEQEVRYKIISAMVRDFPNQVAIAYTPDDFRRLHGEGKFAIFISMLNAYPLGNDLNQLDLWAARGMRMFGFSYVGNNAWSDSSRPLPFFNDSVDALDGLSDIGKQAVQRLNDLGVIIDVSQMSTKALEQVAQLSRTPMVASHSAPRAAVDIPRNLSDKELQLIKQSGGVVQIVGFSAYLRPLSQPTQDKLNQLRARFDLPPLPNLAMALMPGDAIIAAWPEQKFGEYASALYAILDEEPKASLKDLGDAIDYTVRKIGIDHVGLSSDFNDGGGIDGWNNVGEIRNVTAELIQRGYSEADIAKLWGGNFLRVWEQVQHAAKPVAQR
jgi:microsomal dipeptidase-like Zn-dependent dipeptidase